MAIVPVTFPTRYPTVEHNPNPNPNPDPDPNPTLPHSLTGTRQSSTTRSGHRRCSGRYRRHAPPCRS
eukprot:scaffold61654_cov33-Phaeocystis_antarctica.AAC.2